MAGFGISPYGTTPFGLGTPAVAATVGGKLLNDAATGTQSGSRFLDPVTGDYVVDGFGRIKGMDDLRQLVLLRVKTTIGTSTMTTLGNTLKSIDRITNNIDRRVDSILRASLQDIVDGGLIEVTEVKVEVVRPGTVYARLRWRSLITGLDDEAAVPITR